MTRSGSTLNFVLSLEVAAEMMLAEVVVANVLD